jgi:hypothetical protein
MKASLKLVEATIGRVDRLEVPMPDDVLPATSGCIRPKMVESG